MDLSNKTLRLLLVEDSEWDATLLLKRIEHGGFAVDCLRVEKPQQMRKALEEHSWDIIISDYVMPQFSGLDALAIAKQTGQDLPFIIVSGHIGEEIAVASMKAGAHDYVMKDKLARLVPAIERELREAEVRRQRRASEKALRESEEKFRQLAEHLERRVAERTATLRQTNAELRRQINERKRLENELLEIADKERRRIGIDLHDELGQQLNGLALMIKGLELKLEKRSLPEAADASKIHGLISKSIQQARAVARDLASQDIETDDLNAAMKDLASHVENLFQITCRLRLPASVPPLPQMAVKQLYKIAQEATTNAIKHGKAKEVEISVTLGQDHVILQIQNDGFPFPMKRIDKSGMGLRIMEYRASVISGAIQVGCGPDSNGTVVSCTVPVNPETGIGESERPVEKQ